MNATRRERQEPTTAAADGPGKRNKKKSLNWKYVGGAAAGAAIVGVLLFRSCGPAEEGPMRDAQCEECAPAPEKGDGNCEVSKGEHDPFSDKFDPESCGFCGDNVQNVWLVDGEEVGRETADSCLADFACGHPGVDQETIVAVIDENPMETGIDYQYATRPAISCEQESPNYCEQVCQPEEQEPRKRATKRRRRRRAKRDRTPAKTTASARSSGLEKCPAAVTGSGQARMLRREAFNRVVAKGRHIQEALGAAGRAVLVTVSTVVDSRGRVRQKSVTA
ncbi:hypothetical protein GF318_02255, partial [Candidatus Micrarchaeota archaeon]|nr:hypothetical protein [Candidatus Micrarchaeota archaeon]